MLPVSNAAAKPAVAATGTHLQPKSPRSQELPEAPPAGSAVPGKTPAGELTEEAKRREAVRL